jgi:hypothetical protein
MTNEQLIAKFNPANGSNLTAEDLETLRGLTDQQIDVLADAYPNKPTRRSYLRLYDTTLPANKQLFQLSTWQNLRNVRKFSNKKNLIAYDFHTTAQSLNQQARQQMAQRPGAAKPGPKVVVDLTAQEAADELKKVAQGQAKAPEVTGDSGKVTEKPKTEAPKTTGKKSEQAKGAKAEQTGEQTDAPKQAEGAVPADQQMANIDETGPTE